MIVFEDVDFSTMTKASLENHVAGLQRGSAIWLAEHFRCANAVKTSKNKMEREYWQGRANRAKENERYAKRAADYLQNILNNHY